MITRRSAVGMLAGAAVSAQSRPPELDDFERNAARAKRAGATHVVITENFPPALWQFDTPGDPYPAWFVYQPALMKIFPPAMVEPHVNLEYAEKIASLFQARCEMLRRQGLKAVYTCNEPHVLPESFFADHPELRGPRVDQPNRSRKARFTPCVDRPEVLALYRESMQRLLKRCPEVELFSFLTSDSGAGLCWTPALYPGINGPAHCQKRPMDERVTGFLMALREAAGRRIEVDITGIQPRQWMLPTFDRPELIARKLPEGLAVDHFEGPAGTRVTARRFPGGGSQFSPVLGIPRPVRLMRAQPPGHLVVSLGDPPNLDLNLRVLESARQRQPRTELESLTALRELAGKDDQLALWLALDEAERYLETLDFGPVLTMGCVLARWINRPFVPFPAELTFGEKSHYRPFLFQAKGEDQADNLIDIQAMRMYEGWGARLLVQNIVEKVTASLGRAESLARNLPGAELLGQRLAVLQCFVRTVDHAVSYQAQLDRARAQAPPDPNPPLGVQSGWDRQDLMRIARNEIDNAVRLRSLLQASAAPLVDTASTAAEETMRKLGPDLPGQLKRKIDIMNAHWEDYKRLFTTPNP